MDKIQIKKVTQGRTKLSDGTYAVVLHTKWGCIGVTAKTLNHFLNQNPHLSNVLQPDIVYAEDLVGRYVYVAKKSVERVLDGMIYKTPQLF